MSYGTFESAFTDGTEHEAAKRSADKALRAAIFEAREKFGAFLGAATDKQDFGDRVALVKPQMRDVVEAHLMPVTGVMRKVVRACRPDFKRTGTANNYVVIDEETLAGHENFNRPGATVNWNLLVYGPEIEQQMNAEAESLGGEPGPASGYAGEASRREAESADEREHEPPNWDPRHPDDRWERPDPDIQHMPNYQRDGSRKTAVGLRDAPELDTDKTFSPSEGDLIPEGDFEGYLDDVDQDAPSRVTEHNFSGGAEDNFTGTPESNFASKKGRKAIRKEAPFGPYADWDACIAANKGKVDDVEAYCGSIKHQVEDKKSSRKLAVSVGDKVRSAWGDLLGDGEVVSVENGQVTIQWANGDTSVDSDANSGDLTVVGTRRTAAGNLIGWWNQETGAVWVEDPHSGNFDRTIARLEPAFSQIEVYDQFGEAGFMRWDNLHPNPAPLYNCSLSEPGNVVGSRKTAGAGFVWRDQVDEFGYLYGQPEEGDDPFYPYAEVRPDYDDPPLGVRADAYRDEGDSGETQYFATVEEAEDWAEDTMMSYGGGAQTSLFGAAR